MESAALIELGGENIDPLKIVELGSNELSSLDRFLLYLICYILHVLWKPLTSRSLALADLKDIPVQFHTPKTSYLMQAGKALPTNRAFSKLQSESLHLKRPQFHRHLALLDLHLFQIIFEYIALPNLLRTERTFQSTSGLATQTLVDPHDDTPALSLG